MVRKVAFGIVALICIGFFLAAGIQEKRHNGVTQQLTPPPQASTTMPHDLHGGGHPIP